MSKTTIFYSAIIVAIIAIALSVYYIMPGYNHLLVTHDAAAAHPTHALLFGVIAVVCIVGALIYRPRATAR